MKRIVGLNKWDGTRLACESIRVDTFKHLNARRLIFYTYVMLSFGSSCVVHMSYYFGLITHIGSKVERFDGDDYQLNNVYRNLFSAVIERIQIIQRNKPMLSD